MPRLHISEGQIGHLSRLIAGYIAEQREMFHGKARPIGSEESRPLRQFFPADVLDRVRVVRGRAPEPSFYPPLLTMGIDNAPPFSDMAGITFQDVVVHVEPLNLPLLFHELVHAVQYKHLGLPGFAEAYVRGFLKRRLLRRNPAGEAGVWVGGEICRQSSRRVLSGSGRNRPNPLESVLSGLDHHFGAVKLFPACRNASTLLLSINAEPVSTKLGMGA
jgi:hypothetical protein